MFFSQAAGQYADDCAQDSSHFQRYARNANGHYQNYASQDGTCNYHFSYRAFTSFDFLFNLLVSVKNFVRQQIFTNEHHVQHTSDGNRDTNPSIFEETEGILNTSCLQSAVSNDIRRSTYHGDDTTPTASKCQRHQLTGCGDFSCGADTQCNRQQASCSTSVGQNCGQNSTNEHQAKHQAVFASAAKAYYYVTNLLSKAGIEHCCTYNEHACEQYYSRVRQTGEYLFCGDETQQAASDCARHCSNCQRDEFGYKEQSNYCQHNETFYCISHYVFLLL